MLKRNCPGFIITKNVYNAQYSKLISDRNSIQVYFGDSLDTVISALKGVQFAIFQEKELSESERKLKEIKELMDSEVKGGFDVLRGIQTILEERE